MCVCMSTTDVISSVCMYIYSREDGFHTSIDFDVGIHFSVLYSSGKKAGLNHVYPTAFYGISSSFSRLSKKEFV